MADLSPKNTWKLLNYKIEAHENLQLCEVLPLDVVMFIRWHTHMIRDSATKSYSLKAGNIGWYI